MAGNLAAAKFVLRSLGVDFGCKDEPAKIGKNPATRRNDYNLPISDETVEVRSQL